MTDRSTPTPHWIPAYLRKLREAAGLSLIQVEHRFGVKSVVVGSYERGDRHPTVEAVDRLLGCYGMRLDVVTIDATAASTHTRTPAEMAATLRAIAEQLDPGEDLDIRDEAIAKRASDE